MTSSANYVATADELLLQHSSTHVATLAQLSSVRGLNVVVECSFSCRIQLSPIPGIFSGGAAIVRLQDLRRLLVILSRNQIDNATRILAAVPSTKILAHVVPSSSSTAIAICFEGNEFNVIRYAILQDCGVPVVTSFFFVQDVLPSSTAAIDPDLVLRDGEDIPAPLGNVASVAVSLKDAETVEELHLSQLRATVLNHVLTHQQTSPVIRIDLPEDKAGVHINETALELFLPMSHQRLIYLTDDVRVKAALVGAKQPSTAPEVKDRCIAVSRGTLTLFKKKSALPPPLWSFCVSWFHVTELVVHDVRATRDFSVTVVLDASISPHETGDVAPMSALVGDDDCAFETAVMLKIEFVDSDRRSAFVTAAQNARLACTNAPLMVSNQRGAASVLPYPFFPLWSTAQTVSIPVRSKKSTLDNAPTEAELSSLALLFQSRTSVMIFLYHTSICSQQPLLAGALANHIVAYFTSLPHLNAADESGSSRAFRDSPSERLVEAAVQVGFLASSTLPNGHRRVKEVPLAWEICKAFIKEDVKLLLLHCESSVGDQTVLFATPIDLPSQVESRRIISLLKFSVKYFTAIPVAAAFVTKLICESAQLLKVSPAQIHSDVVTHVQAWVDKLVAAGSAAASSVLSTFSATAFSLRNLVATLVKSDDDYFEKERHGGVHMPSALDLALPSHPLRNIFSVHALATGDMLSELLQGTHAVDFVNSIAMSLSADLARKGSVFVQRHEATQTLRTSADEERLLTRYLEVRAKLELLEQVNSSVVAPAAAAGDPAALDPQQHARDNNFNISKYSEEARRMLLLEKRNDELMKLVETATNQVATLTSENTSLRDECRQLRVNQVVRSFDKTAALLMQERSNFVQEQETCSRDAIALAADRERFEMLVQLMVPLLSNTASVRKGKKSRVHKK